MAKYICERVDLFPSGTKIKAYPRLQGRLNEPQLEGDPGKGSTAPTGNVQEVEMTGTPLKAEFTALTAGQSYVLYAKPTLWNQQTNASEAVDRYLLITVPAEATVPAPYDPVGPAAQKLLGWTFDPAMIQGGKVLLTSGKLYVAKILIPEACKITNLIWMNVKETGTPTTGEQIAGLFNEGGTTVIGECKPSAVATAFALKEKEGKVALETPVNVPAGFIWAAFGSVGTTGPQLGIASTATSKAASGVNFGATRFGEGAEVTATALPAKIGTITALEFPIWAAVS